MKSSVSFAILLILGVASPTAAPASSVFIHYEAAGRETIEIKDQQLIHHRPTADHASLSQTSVPLTPEQTIWVRDWLARHRVFTFAADYPTTNSTIPSAGASLALRLDQRERVITWESTSRCPEVTAAINELQKFVGAVIPSSTAPQAANGSLSVETSLAEILKPAKKLPFKSVVHATTQHVVLDFDPANTAHANFKKLVAQAATAAGRKAFTEGIFTARANEAGNHIEEFVRAALREAGLPAQIPVTTAGNAQATGYPDVEIVDAIPAYLELKTYNENTVNTTQRTFYFSPSGAPKITKDALHLLLAYQMEKATRNGKPAFVPVHWKLITLQDLLVDLKFEFNQSNRGMYGPDAAKALLAEGTIE